MYEVLNGFQLWIFKNKFKYRDDSGFNQADQFEIYMQELVEVNQDYLFEWIEEYAKEEYEQGAKCAFELTERYAQNHLTAFKK